MIAGIEIDVGPDAVWVRSALPLRTLASAVVGADLEAAPRQGTVAGWLLARVVRRAVAQGIAPR